MNLFVVFLLVSWAELNGTITFHREARFTRVRGYFRNESLGNVIEFKVRNNNGHHYIDGHVKILIPVSPKLIKLEVNKCKEYYIDCQNYHSFILNNFCRQTEVLNSFINNKIFTCPFQNDVKFQNVSLNTDLIMSTLSTTLLEPWWDKYWTLKSAMMLTDNLPYALFELDFYFISVSSLQNRRPKKN